MACGDRNTEIDRGKEIHRDYSAGSFTNHSEDVIPNGVFGVRNLSATATIVGIAGKIPRKTYSETGRK
jgi:hypothetical protein